MYGILSSSFPILTLKIIFSCLIALIWNFGLILNRSSKERLVCVSGIWAWLVGSSASGFHEGRGQGVSQDWVSSEAQLGKDTLPS